MADEMDFSNEPEQGDPQPPEFVSSGAEEPEGAPVQVDETEAGKDMVIDENPEEPRYE